MRRDVTGSAEAKREDAVQNDPDIIELRNATPAQVNDWVDANVTTVAGARRALKVLFRLALRTRR